AKSLEPFGSLASLVGALPSAPNLTSGVRVVVKHEHTCTALSRANTCGHAGRTRPDHNSVGVRHEVETTIPFRTGTWQLRQSWRPSMVIRHSKQMPIPHRAARGCPVTEVRNFDRPLRSTAAATVLPGSTLNSRP